jgi:hypothetical protein
VTKAITVVDKMSDSERREHFCTLMEEVVLPHRRRLLQASDHTWQSAYVDDDGYLAELIAALVVGVPGNQRRGVSTSTGDLSDRTEVKKGSRVDPNIDFVLDGRFQQDGRRVVLEVPALPSELRLQAILHQANSNACSVQLLERQAGVLLGGALWRTVGKDALRPDKRGGGTLTLARGSQPFPIGQEVQVCLRQERGHVNYGDKSRSELAKSLKSTPVFVFYQHDMRGRFSVAVIEVRMSASEQSQYLNVVYAGRRGRRQVQPYLFPDNVRDALYDPRSVHSVAGPMNGRLLAYGVEANSGFELLHWNVQSPPLVKSVEPLLTRIAPPSKCPAFRHERLSLDWSDQKRRLAFAASFFNESIAGYNRSLQPYCEMTRTTRNIGLGNLAQHLAGLCTGLRGTRSGARGSDLIEPDGETPSEVKLATGQAGDAMGTEDMPRLTLGWDHAKMVGWKRLVAVRIVEFDEGNGPRWHATVHAPTLATMKLFRAQVRGYFRGRVNNGSGGLQYHTVPYPHDVYGTEDRNLKFVPVGVFEEGEAARFPNTFPDW